MISYNSQNLDIIGKTVRINASYEKLLNLPALERGWDYVTRTRG